MLCSEGIYIVLDAISKFNDEISDGKDKTC
jgi:hypothetical protein